MEFIIFLGKLDKEILDLLTRANYTIEENKIEITLTKNYDKTKLINHVSNKLSLHPSIFSVKKVDQLPLTKNLKYKYR